MHIPSLNDVATLIILFLVVYALEYGVVWLLEQAGYLEEDESNPC